jgi:hypothetical protein
MKLKNIRAKSILLVICFGVICSLVNRPVAQTICKKCVLWQAKVDSNITTNQLAESEEAVIVQKSSLEINSTQDNWISKLSRDEMFEAIECLLKLKGKKNGSKISGATKLDTSRTFDATSVEVAGLYYISYLYYQKWGHAGAPFLVNKKGELNTDESVLAAYEAYNNWYRKVKEIGLEEAKKQKLDPLAGSDVSWY